MNDGEKAIRILEGKYKNCVLRHNGEVLTVNELIALLKDSRQDEGWLCEKRTTGRRINDLLCACGDKPYFTTLLFEDGFTANELHCPNCGLSMRSPGTDKDGVWLKKHWEEVVLKAPEPVEPILDSRAIEFYRCGYCNEPLEKFDKYCWNCGRAVKWE